MSPQHAPFKCPWEGSLLFSIDRCFTVHGAKEGEQLPQRTNSGNLPHYHHCVFFKLVIWSPPPARLILPELPTSYVNDCNLSWHGVRRAPLSMMLEAEGQHWIKQMETCLIPETFSMHLLRISGYVCIHDVSMASFSLPSSTLRTFSISCRSDICRVLWFYWFS